MRRWQLLYRLCALGLDQRFGEHNAGTYGGYASIRRPVTLVWAQHFLLITDAMAVERRIKGWSRAKKAALIRSGIASPSVRIKIAACRNKFLLIC